MNPENSKRGYPGSWVREGFEIGWSLVNHWSNSNIYYDYIAIHDRILLWGLPYILHQCQGPDLCQGWGPAAHRNLVATQTLFPLNHINCTFWLQKISNMVSLCWAWIPNLHNPRKHSVFKNILWGILGWRRGLALAFGPGPDPGDRIPRQAPGAWSLLLPLPVSLSLSLSLTIINKK